MMRISCLLQHLYLGECESGSVSFLRPYMGLKYVHKWSLKTKKRKKKKKKIARQVKINFNKLFNLLQLSLPPYRTSIFLLQNFFFRPLDRCMLAEKIWTVIVLVTSLKSCYEVDKETVCQQLDVQQLLTCWKEN